MVSPAVFSFMKRCFTRCTIYESYGVSECGGVTHNNSPKDTLEYRLESVPEMGYTLNDHPYPRGELLTKTPQMFSGYINNQEETQAALTADGFFRTGDIVELHTDENDQVHIRIIDRKKNFFKLAQGQFVSPEYLQSIYIQSPFVEQIYIHGDLLADSVFAVVVPNQKYAQAYAREHPLSDLSNAVLQDLRLIGKKEALRSHEIPSQIIIDYEPFTSENGLLTSSLKPCRHKLAAHYAHRFKPSNNIEQRLKNMIETTTGQSISTDQTENVFLHLGGDSLAAVRLSRMIENDLGVTLPLDILFDPKMTLQQLITSIQHPTDLSTFSQSIVSQLLKDSSEDLNIRVDGYKPATTSPSKILITGTTGFVGAFLLAELLSTYPHPCQFVCLVRCDDRSMNPFDRIRKKMLFYQIWKDEYQQRILAIRSDLAQTHFGLDDQTYQSLAQEIDIIYHCGATVNFVFPYNQMYGPNVCGTREIIHFATHLSSACIPIQYISTISVLSSDIDKEICIDEISPDRLKSGYAQSKWVAEKLISQASRCGVKVMIYRLGLISADSRSGACNEHDLYTILFDGMMKMNCYPESAKDIHLNGLPVDFTAKSIVYLSRMNPDVSGKVYHVMNVKNEIGFEKIVDGMKECGIEMTCITNDEWKMKLKGINEQDKILESIRKFFSNIAFKKRNTISADQFWDAVRTLDYPSTNDDYVLKWLHFILFHINKIAVHF